MAFVGARMHGNSLGAETFAIKRYFYEVGVVAAARIPDGGNFVYIYAQFSHVSIIRLLDIRSFDLLRICFRLRYRIIKYRKFELTKPKLRSFLYIFPSFLRTFPNGRVFGLKSKRIVDC